LLQKKNPNSRKKVPARCFTHKLIFYILFTYAIHHGRKQWRRDGYTDQWPGRTLKEGNGHATARRQGPQNAHPQWASVTSENWNVGSVLLVDDLNLISECFYSIPAFHFFGWEITKAPRHFGGTQNQTKNKSKKDGDKHAQQQRNETDFLHGQNNDDNRIREKRQNRWER
jgi:hypothetical protein